MPTRSYGNVNLFNVVDSDEEILNGSISGTGFNRVGSAIATDDNAKVSLKINAELDFTDFPSIPASATISKVEVDLTISGVTTGTGGAHLLRIAIFRAGGATLLEQQTTGVQVVPVTLNTPINYTDNTGYTRSQLITQYSELELWFDAISSSAGLRTADLTTSAFTLTVTYDLESYSWYIKPKIKVVNGKKVRTINNISNDIITVSVDEEPPKGYELWGERGKGSDYPNGPTYLWWTSHDFYAFYIYSPISPGLLSFPFDEWVALPEGEVPVCVGCLTMTLDALEVLVADASGVYTLVKNKKDDTLYNRETEDTTDVKIPNPFARTGFIS